MERLIWGDLPQWTETFSGSGYGYGDGDGYGYGSGDGYGYGDGYWKMVAQSAIAKLPASVALRLEKLSSEGGTLAFWKSTKDGQPANGGNGEAVYPGLIQKTSGPLQLCQPGTLHATLKPEKWKGERLWIVALIGQTVWAEDKIGALEREIIGEVIL